MNYIEINKRKKNINHKLAGNFTILHNQNNKTEKTSC